MKNVLRRFDSVFDFSRSNIEFIKAFNRNVRHINFGYDSKYDFSKNKDNMYDLVFIGSSSGVDNRRSNILDNLKERYKFFDKHEDIWRHEKYEAITNSKIALNIHFDHSVVFEPFRFFEYLSQRTLLITEITLDSYPFVDGVDYISINQNNYNQIIDFYLNSDTDREKIAINGYNKAKMYTREQTMAFLLQCIQVDLANKRNSNLVVKFLFKSYRIAMRLRLFFLKIFKKK
jgi:hypothetical protein